VALDHEEDHDSLVGDMAVGRIGEVDLGFEVVEDIPFEEAQTDILDCMLVVPSAVHVRAALAVGIVRIDHEAGNQELDRIVIDLAVVLLVVPHMVVGHLAVQDNRRIGVVELQVVVGPMGILGHLGLNWDRPGSGQEVVDRSKTFSTGRFQWLLNS